MTGALQAIVFDFDGVIADSEPLHLRAFQQALDDLGLALDRESFIHAPSTEGVVRVERLSAPYWTKRFIGARRIMAGDAAPD